MQTVMILCGGESSEHEVSLQSANSIIQNIPLDRYRPLAVAITKEGQWVTGKPLLENETDPTNICLSTDLKPAIFKDQKLNGAKIDIIFPIIHGTYGEDGCLQGLLQMQHTPYVGAGVLGSAVSMDKDITKKLLLQKGIHCAAHRIFYRWDTAPNYEELIEELGTTIFIKPCNLGSSVGISKCKNREEFEQGIKNAFAFDNKILVEEFIQGKEIEVAVLGNESPKISIPGEIIPGAEFYSYDSKYIDGNRTKIKIPAELTDSIKTELQTTALNAFKALELYGLSRVDFFVDQKKKVWLNEVNTLPGFTSISMYPKLWAASGIEYPELIHQLLQLAVQRYQLENRLNRNRK
jgi:D-alanine-D-alanine ligase